MTISTKLFSALTFATLAWAQGGTVDPNNRFIYPPQGGQTINQNASVYSANINITYGAPQRQSFQWITEESEIALVLWQEGNPESVQMVQLFDCGSSASQLTEFYWDGDIGSIDINNGSVAFLAGYSCPQTAENNTPIMFSHYFNLTRAATTTTTTSSSSTSTPTPTSTTSSSGAGDTTPTPTPIPANNQNDGGSSNAAALGGGIGGGIGGALVLIAIGIFFFMRRRRNHQETQPYNQQGATPMSQGPPNGYSPGHNGYFAGSSAGASGYNQSPGTIDTNKYAVPGAIPNGQTWGANTNTTSSTTSYGNYGNTSELYTKPPQPVARPQELPS